MTFDLDAAMSGTATFPYSWNPDYGARVGLLPRDGDQWRCHALVRGRPLLRVPPDERVRPPGRSGRVRRRASSEDVRHRPQRPERRVTEPGALDASIPPPAASHEEVLDDRGQEFPRHDERLVGRRNRYGYTAAFGAGVEHGPALKHDLDAGTTEVHEYGPGRVTLEPVFVPRTPRTPHEDDGWIMSYVYDATTDSSDVVILHAQDFTGEPVAVISSAAVACRSVSTATGCPTRRDPHAFVRLPVMGHERFSRLRNAPKQSAMLNTPTMATARTAFPSTAQSQPTMISERIPASR